MSITLLDSIIPRQRDFEPAGIPVDGRYSPSFVDLGSLQSRACALAAQYGGQDPFPKNYIRDVVRMVRLEVRHVVEVEPDLQSGRVFFTTKDAWGLYTYAFGLKSEWFTKVFTSGHEM